MKTSARNQLNGVVKSIKTGAINSEVVVKLATGQELVAMITCESAENLGLTVGSEVVALIKASQIILATELNGFKFSARNQLAGVVKAVQRGTVNAVVTLDIGGVELTVGVTLESSENLALTEGKKAVALFKASGIILGVKA